MRMAVQVVETQAARSDDRVASAEQSVLVPFSVFGKLSERCRHGSNSREQNASY